MEIDDRYVAATPEGVSLEFVLAGLGSRFVAILIDTIIQVAILLLLVLGLSASGLFNGPTAQYVGTGILALALFLIMFGYFVLFETLDGGRSPGKRAGHLRVIRLDGGAVGLRASLLRNIVRLVDFLPVGYGLGATLILATGHNQRLGDLAGATIVIRTRTDAMRAAATQPWNDSAQWAGAFAPSPTSVPPGAPMPWAASATSVGTPAPPGAPSPWASGASVGTPAPTPTAWLPPELAHWDVTRVGDREMEVVRAFLERRANYSVDVRGRLAEDLARRLRPLVAGPTSYIPPEVFLEGVWLAKSARR